jgi:hypothetical protein
MRRQKCDRQMPCGRCVRRGEGDTCTRKWPDGGYDPKIHRIYPSKDNKESESGHTAAHASPTSSVNGLTDSSLHPSLRTPASLASGSILPEQSPRRQSDVKPSHATAPGVKESTSTIEFIGWAPSKLSDYGLSSIQLVRDAPKDGADWEFSNGFWGTAVSQISFLQLLLPSKLQVFQIVEYHIESVLWYHSCFHGPTFYRELQDAAQGPAGLQLKSVDLRWAALLFSVMAGSLVTAPAHTALSWGFQKDERAKLTRQWFKATVTCLNLADYMWRHHLYSVEAIAVLTMSAHILGFSTTQSSLLGTALRIAQGLGLHRLGPEDDEPRYASGTGRIPMIHPAQRQKIIQRELGRRVWSQLCKQDWFSVGTVEMYSIQRLHFKTIRPLSINEQTLEILPDEIPTGTQFANVLNYMASLCAQMHDAVAGANTLFTKYEHALEYDEKMRAAITENLPKYLDSREPVEPHWPPWIPWARRSLNLCANHKIIMFHRPFLGSSFTEPCFEYSRRACLAASKSILREAKQAYDEEGPSLWIDQAFMVAAGIVLALDTFHRQETESEFEEHRKLAETTMTMLGKFENSAIGQRGSKLLSSLLTEQARMHANSALDTYRKRTISGADAEAAPKRQKFDVPKFVEAFIGHDSFTNCLKTSARGPESVTDSSEIKNATMPDGCPTESRIVTPEFEKFEQLFPPHTGISNSFLFEDLLNFDL